MSDLELLPKELFQECAMTEMIYSVREMSSQKDQRWHPIGTARHCGIAEKASKKWRICRAFRGAVITRKQKLKPSLPQALEQTQAAGDEARCSHKREIFHRAQRWGAPYRRTKYWVSLPSERGEEKKRWEKCQKKRTTVYWCSSDQTIIICKGLTGLKLNTTVSPSSQSNNDQQKSAPETVKSIDRATPRRLFKEHGVMFILPS